MQLPRQPFRSLNQIDDDLAMAVFNENEEAIALLQQERNSVLGQVQDLGILD